MTLILHVIVLLQQESQCEFEIKLSGAGLSQVRTPVTFQIGNNATSSDSRLVNAIDMPRDTFYKPSNDETNAKALMA